MSGLMKSPAMVGLFGLLALAGMLELAVFVEYFPSFVVPRPSDTVMAFHPVQQDMDLIGNFFVTLGMTAAATGLALAIGIPFGYFLYRNPTYGIAYEGWLAAAFAAPCVSRPRESPWSPAIATVRIAGGTTAGRSSHW